MIVAEPIRLALVAGLAVAVSLAGSAWLARWLARRRVLDRPNERSSHAVPTPRGAGIAVVSAAVAAWALGRWIETGEPPADAAVLAAAVLLGVVSFADDLRGLPAAPRLAAQVLAVAAGLWVLSETGGPFAAILPPALDLGLSGLLWMWFVNLFNFMDGIDGLSGVETAAIATGLAGLAATGLAPAALLDPSVALLAAALGFLAVNWAPARVFLGDVGSVPLGYLLGWLLLSAAAGAPGEKAAWAAAAILPAYYLADATIVLAGRLWRRENIFRAHRLHFYQRAAAGGRSHAAVCRRVILCDAALVLAAWGVAPSRPALALALAAAAVAALLLWMARAARGAGPEPGR